MAIEAQISAGYVFGNRQDLLTTENAAFGLNNPYLTNPQQSNSNSKPQQIPKFNDDHHHHHPSISQIISAQIENQRVEIDHYINFQNERLRRAVQEQRMQQTSVLMKKYGWKIQNLMRQKDEEIAKEAKKNMELQDVLRGMEAERVTWQRLAQESEAAAAAMSGTIQRLREAAGAEDAESCCSGEEREREVERGRGRGRERGNRKMVMVCRWCNCRESCVIMLPCRHLCSCRDCDAFLDSCPLCNLPKKATLEAAFF